MFLCSALGRFAPATSQMKNRMASSLKMGVKFENADRKLRVAIVGGGPSGSCAAEILAQVGACYAECPKIPSLVRAQI